MMMERGREAEGWGDYWGREKEGVFTAGWNLFFNTEIKRGSASERKHALFSEKADLKCIAATCVSGCEYLRISFIGTCEAIALYCKSIKYV